MWLPTSFALVATFALLCLPHGTAGGSDFLCSSGRSLDVCLEDNYSKFQLPKMEEVNEIGVGIHLDEVTKVDDNDYTITFKCYFNLDWVDPRLTLGDAFKGQPNSTMIPVSADIVADLYLPNVYIYNLKDFEVKGVLVPLMGLWVDSEKKLLHSQAAHITFVCSMNFQKFPFDTQNCKFQLGSYSYSNSEMHFVQKEYGYLSKKGNSIALDYHIGIKSLDLEDQTFAGGDLGNFSLAGFEIVLTRRKSTYIMTYFLPQALLVVVSWISFLLPQDGKSGRAVLLSIVFLVQVNIFNTVAANTPRTQGLTAIEAWMFICILFVFGALIEFSVILFKKQQKQQLSTEHEDYSRIDKYSFICFSLTFFLFNVIYWFSVLL